MEELDDLYLYRVEYGAIELPIKSRGVDLIISLIKLLYSFLHSLNIILLYYRTHLYLTVVSYRIVDDLVCFPSSSSSVS